MTIRPDRPVDRPRPGLVSLVGAGPGSPDLLTVRATRRLQTADLVLYDALVDPRVVDLASQARRFSVGKRAGRRAVEQETIDRLMIGGARRGQRIVRLKSGDPFVLGRGGEEALALCRAGIPFEVVPGITSAVAVPALAGIPLTHRGVSSGFIVVSGHDEAAFGPLLDVLPPNRLTVVVLMGMGRRERIAARLIDAGWRPETGTAIVVGASGPDMRTWQGRLDQLGRTDPEAMVERPEDPGTIVIGDVVDRRSRLEERAEPPGSTVEAVALGHG